MNLLILISDEHRRDAMSCAGHPVARTPVLDRLAARGVRFTNACTPSPMCVPARAALATGLPVHRTGHWDSAAPYDGEPHSWMRALRDAGIPSVAIGKLHDQKGADCGWSEIILPMHVHGAGWTRGLLRAPGERWEGTAELARDVASATTEYTDYDRRVADAAVEWLLRHGAGGPWALFVSFVAPHYPLTAPPEFLERFDPAEVDLPVAYAAAERPGHPELREMAAFFNYDAYFDPPRMRAARAAYYALCAWLDHNVGRTLAALEAAGGRDDTLVLYTSDHGEMLGDHGFWTKQVMYEPSAGVPLIVDGPGMAPGRIRRTPVSLLDVAPTALAAFGLPRPPEYTGADLRALAAADESMERVAFAEYHDGGSTTGSFMVRWARWKYVHYAGMRPQLFDLQADPQERRDLGAHPAHAAVRAEGLRRLRAVCDPEEVSAAAFADQRRRIAALGGRAACRGDFNHTPAPA